MMALAESALRDSVVQLLMHWWNTLDLVLFCGLPIILGVAGWLIGTTVERNHHRRLDEMEHRLLTMPLTDTRAVPPDVRAADGVMVIGSVVLATDYFRTMLATLRKLIGGEIGIYQRLLIRARREAICRMMEEAHRHGAVAVINLRIETSSIGSMSGKRGAMAEIIAYGTAVLPRRTA
jgi:uncharacterized protein YbjQ (UPF0145 family)